MPGDTWVCPVPIVVQRVAFPPPAASLNALPTAITVIVPHGVPFVGTKPVNTIAPAISGTPNPGQTLTSDHGTWIGTAPITYTYQWQKDTVNITGQTASTYVVASGDVGHVIRCHVTATNAYGSAFKNSSSVTISSGTAAPVNTASPSLSGVFIVGAAITCSAGTWTGSPAPTFSYQWLRTSTIAPWWETAAATATNPVYVSPTGSAAYPGTLAAPCSFSTAKNAWLPGDKVMFADGTYNFTGTVSITRGGSAGAYVHLMPINPGAVKFFFNASGGGRGDFIQFPIGGSADYLIFDGIEIDGNSYSCGVGIQVKDTGTSGLLSYHHLIFVNNRIHHCGQNGFEIRDCDYVDVSYNNLWLNGEAGTSNGSNISLHWIGTAQPTLFDSFDGWHNRVWGNNAGGATEQAGASDGNGCLIDNDGNDNAVKTIGNTLVGGNTWYMNGGRGFGVLGCQGNAGSASGILVVADRSYKNGLDTTTLTQINGNGAEFDNNGGKVTFVDCVAQGWDATGNSVTNAGTTPFRDSDVSHSVTVIIDCYKFGGRNSSPIAGVNTLAASPYQSPPTVSNTASNGYVNAPDPALLGSTFAYTSAALSAMSVADAAATSGLTTNQINGMSRGGPILGATSSTYTTIGIDAGMTLACVVTATNSVGSASASSEGESITSSPGPMAAFTLADIGWHRYHPSDPQYVAALDNDWEAPRYYDLYVDTPPFGRTDKRTPDHTYAGILVFKADGTIKTAHYSGEVTNLLSTAGTIPLDGTAGVLRVDHGDGTYSLTNWNLQVQALAVEGSTSNNRQLAIGGGATPGRLWMINDQWTGAGNLAEYNALYHSTTGFVQLHYCVVALQNVLFRGGYGGDPMVRFDNCDAQDDATPYVDGFWWDGFTRDQCKPGSLCTRFRMRHGSCTPHKYVRAFIDPTQPPANYTDLFSGSGTTSDPWAWESTRTYGLHEAIAYPNPVFDPNHAGGYGKGAKVSYSHWNWQAAKLLTVPVPAPNSDGTDSVNWTRDKKENQYFSLHAANTGALPATDGFGQFNADWQFYGNPHADFFQPFVCVGPTAAGDYAWENVLCLKGNHVALFYAEGALKVHLKDLYDQGAWSSAGPPATSGVTGRPNTPAGWYHGDPNPNGNTTPPHIADLVRASNGQEFYAVQDSGPATSAGSVDPLDAVKNAGYVYWIPSSSHGLLGKYCIGSGRELMCQNACGDPSNGVEDSLLVPGWTLAHPVEGQGSDSSGTVRNVRNYYTDSSGLIPGSTLS